MSKRTELEIIAEDEFNLYDYWKVLVKRKKIFISIFLVPVIIVTIINLSLPCYYRGESEISVSPLPSSSIFSAIQNHGTNIISVIPAQDIINFIGVINDSKKVKIFRNNPDAIKSVSITKKSNDKVNIIVEAETSDSIPEAIRDIYDYFCNLPEVTIEIGRVKELIDLKQTKLSEAKKANLIYLNHIIGMMKTREIKTNYINPADLITKDADLSLEIRNLQKVKVTAGILGPISINNLPSNAQIKRRIINTGLISLFVGILIVFFLEYIDKAKAREKGRKMQAQSVQNE